MMNLTCTVEIAAPEADAADKYILNSSKHTKDLDADALRGQAEHHGLKIVKLTDLNWGSTYEVTVTGTVEQLTSWLNETHGEGGWTGAAINGEFKVEDE